MKPPVLPRVADRRLLRRIFLSSGGLFLLLVLLPVIFYVEENSRGSRAWARCRQELTARGERLDRAAFIPPPVPEAQNLAFAPPFPELLAYRDDAGRPRFGKPPPPRYKELQSALKDVNGRPPPPGADWRTGRRVDLDALARYLQPDGMDPAAAPARPAAEVIRAALEPFAPTLDALAQASAVRLAARFPLDYDAPMVASIGMSHLTLLQNLVRLLQTRALTSLAAGRSDAALADLRLALRLVSSLQDEPSLIACLVQNTCLGFTLNVVWQGLADRRWSADELTEITAMLGQAEVLGRCANALRAERGFFYLPLLEYIERGGGADLAQLVGEKSFAPAGAVMRAIPHGWYDQNRAVGCRFTQELLDAVDPASHRVDPRRIEACQERQEALRHRFTPEVWFAQLVLPALGSVPRAAARVQTGVDHAIAACALERFFLTRGEYPAALDALPDADRLPRDLVDGVPLRYARTADARYRLWSVGWDGRDEGGRVVFKDLRVDEKLGDWVWQYSPPPDAPKPLPASNARVSSAPSPPP